MKRYVLAFVLLLSIALTGCECKHDWRETSKIKPGCIKEGIVSYICSKCNATYENIISATGHSTEKGLCDYCGYIITKYGVLGQDEALVFSKMVEACTAFKNPASVRLIDVIQIGKDNNSCVVTISAENSYGASSKEDYNISDDGTVLEVSWLGVNKDNKEYDIASINEALQTYYRSMGWTD